MIQLGANVNETDNVENTSFHYSLEHENLDCLRLLIELVVNPNEGDNIGKTPLHYSAEQGDFYCLKLLVKQQAKVNMLDNQGKTRPSLFCRKRSLPDVNSNDKIGKTPLHYSKTKRE